MIEEKLDRMIELLEIILNKLGCPCYPPVYRPWVYDPCQPHWITCTDDGTSNATYPI